MLENTQCLVSKQENINKWYALKDVCKDLPLDYDGYCVLHYPDKEKSRTTNFNEVLNERLVKNEINFDYVFFPNPVFLDNREFLNKVSFYGANFSDGAFFQDSIFKENVDFTRAKFNGAVFTKTIFEKMVWFTNSTFEDISEDLIPEGYVLQGAYFREAVFQKFTNFSSVKFLTKTDFSGVKFEGYTDFRFTIFIDDVLYELVQFFNEVDFRSVTFRKGAYFHRIIIQENSKINFIWTSFQQIVRFDQAIIKGYLHFEAGDGDIFDGKWSTQLVGDRRPEIEKRFTPVFEDNAEFNHTGTEKPERITFNKVRLRPSWFVNVDSRKFNFTDVNWENNNGKKTELRQELNELKVRFFNVPHNYKLLTISLRNLASNAEEFTRFEEASNFRKSAFECEKLERKAEISKWWDEPISCSNIFCKVGIKIKTLPYDLFHWGYRWSSGYGENRLWAFFILFLIIFISSIFYATPLCEFPNGQNGVRSLEFIESISYSLRVMVLQRPEPFPINTFGKGVLALETVFAPLQAALLALAIRRKFMR